MIDVNVHTLAYNKTIYISKGSSSYPWDSGWNWYGVALGAVEISTFSETVPNTFYSTKHCQGHLMSLYWQFSGWRWSMMPQLRYSQRLFQFLFSVSLSKWRAAWNPTLLIVNPRCFAWRILHLCQLIIYTAVAPMCMLLLAVSSTQWCYTRRSDTVHSCASSRLLACCA